MQDFREELRSAAPQPLKPPDVQAIWRGGLRRRWTQLALAALSMVVIGTGVWTLVEGEYISEFFDRGGVQPADDEGVVSTGPTGKVVLWGVEPPEGPEQSWTVVDLESGESRSFERPEFSVGDAKYKLEYIGDKFVFAGSDGRTAGTYALDTNLRGDPVLLGGHSWSFFPSAADGRVWLDLRNRGSSTLRGGVAEVTVDGEVTLQQSDPPPNGIIGAVNQGLLIQGSGLQVWDPRTDRIVWRMDGVFPVDAHKDVVAWCDRDCPELNLTNLSTGQDTVIVPPEGLRFEGTDDGAFSPDGDMLAVPVQAEDGRRVAIVDVPNATVRVVPESHLNVGYGLLTWTSSADWLLFYGGNGALGAYNPKSGQSKFTHLETSMGFIAMAAN